MSAIVFSGNIVEDLRKRLENYRNQKVFVLVDDNTQKHCFPIIENAFDVPPKIIRIPAGEEHKNIGTVEYLWQSLVQFEADRKSLLINLGGGVISDIGGFVAATFKRGIDYINIPTTLLGMIDASIGGKNGINLNKLKNQVGTFAEATEVLIFTDFLKTLPKRHLTAGFAEMIKHALLDNQTTWRKIKYIDPSNPDFEYLTLLVKESALIKMRYVEQDFQEKGIREALNFGHTVGHAVETFFSNKNIDILHGEAVAIGLIAELFLSNKKFVFDFHTLFEIAEYLAVHFPAYKIEYDHYDAVFEIMKHDKKNKDGQIRFTLLEDIGKVRTNQIMAKEEIFQALNFYYQVKS